MRVGTIPYMGDAYFDDWVVTLERLKVLDFDVILPGHGQPVRDRARIDHLQAYLRHFWSQVSELHRAGVPVGGVARRIDPRAHSADDPSVRALGADSDADERAYELLSRRL